MTTIRRHVLRPGRVLTANDSRRATRTARQRERLTKDRAALKRWLTRLKRAANTVANLQRRIARLESAINTAN